METKIIYKNYAYEIKQNDFSDYPDDYSDDMFLIYDHRDFSVKRDGFKPSDIAENPKDYDDFYIYPVFAYIHSGVSLSLAHKGDKWDTSMRGYLLANKSEFNEENARETALNLIERWNMYLSGEVYDVLIYELKECPTCSHIEYEDVASDWEIYGFEEAERIAKEMIDELHN